MRARAPARARGCSNLPEPARDPARPCPNPPATITGPLGPVIEARPGDRPLVGSEPQHRFRRGAVPLSSRLDLCSGPKGRRLGCVPPDASGRCAVATERLEGRRLGWSRDSGRGPSGSFPASHREWDGCQTPGGVPYFLHRVRPADRC
jgi:hypothetical protein